MDSNTTENPVMAETINKNKSKKAIIIAVILFVLCAIGVAVYLGFIDEEYYMGQLRAELSDGTLTISGKGDMPDFSSGTPWSYKKDKITKVVIKDGVTSVGDSAFLNCNYLETLTISDTVTSIGRYAFAYCSSLESITIPDSVNSIGYGAFDSCPSLESIVVSSGNKVYHSENNCLIETATKTLIVGCKNSVTIPDSVTSIGDYAFAYCDSLESVTIPDSVTSIGDRAFSGCDSLASITIPDSVTSIGVYAFYWCSSLESVTIGDSVTSIGYRAFNDCNSLESVTFKDPNGWYVTETEGASSGIDVDVTDKSTITDYLIDKYTEYYWYKK